jgi:hypothetical protein
LLERLLAEAQAPVRAQSASKRPASEELDPGNNDGLTIDLSGADVMVDVIKSLRLSLPEQTGAIQNAVQCRGSRIVHEHKGKTDFGSVQQAEPPHHVLERIRIRLKKDGLVKFAKLRVDPPFS